MGLLKSSSLTNEKREKKTKNLNYWLSVERSIIKVDIEGYLMMIASKQVKILYFIEREMKSDGEKCINNKIKENLLK